MNKPLMYIATIAALALTVFAPSGFAADDSKAASGDGHSIPKAAVITMGDRDHNMVGIHLTTYALEQMLPKLEEELGTDGSGVVVLRFTSGGGYGVEVDRMVETIETQYKPKFRVVSWIDSAISAAAMTSHCVEEIYFTTQGNYGSCTGYRGAMDAVKGVELEIALQRMEKISAKGGYDTRIMRSMQILAPLSATRRADGSFEYYQDTKSGEIVVNPEERVLCFNAESAKQVGFSKGTADSLSELTTKLGFKELNWVGKQEKGVSWPVSKAEKWNMDWRKRVADAETDFRTLLAKIDMQVAAATAAARADRPKFVGLARETLRKMKRHVDNNPNFSYFEFNRTPEEFNEWYKKTDKQLRDLLK